MSQTYTTTYTSTYTEARARAVMVSVLEDLFVLAASRLLDYDRAKEWMEDLLFLLNARVLNYFEIQAYSSNGSRLGGYKYALKDDGSLQKTPSRVVSTLTIFLQERQLDSLPTLIIPRETLRK